MGLFNWMRNQFIDVIEWIDDSNDTLVWRFPDQDHEIKNGAKLTVRQGQIAIFVNEGEMGDVFTPGLYSLTTQNLPVLTSLRSWKYAFNSPFKAEVYFINTRQYIDLRWGTMNPIMMRDQDFGAVRVRAFGLYAIQVTDGARFFKEIVGTEGHISTSEIDGALKRMLVSSFTTALGQVRIPVLDLAGNYERVAEATLAKMAPEFEAYGLALRKFIIENISLPPEVEKAIDTRSSMGAMGDLRQFTQFQSANAIGDAARNPGGFAGAGVGLGAGVAMGQAMTEAMRTGFSSPRETPAPPAPPPSPFGQAEAGPSFHVVVDGKQMGPYGLDVLRQGAATGQLTGETLVWRAGMAQWTAAGDVPELRALFGGSAPPPVPGAGG
jgi:membrane protease subunit (stomatin/prohibitin family)